MIVHNVIGDIPYKLIHDESCQRYHFNYDLDLKKTEQIS